MLSRRALVGKLAAGVAGGAVALAAGSVRPLNAATKPEDSPQTGDCAATGEPNTIEGCSPSAQTAPWELIQPLAPGAVVAHDWKVSELTGAVDGSCVLTLKNERGRINRIHICRNDGTPQGLAHSKHFDLLVMNGGQGDLPTEEGLAQAVAKIAEHLSANESRNNGLVASLMPHSERLELFASSDTANARLR